MGDCNHEEADTRMVVHVMDSLEKRFNDIVIKFCTIDTNVIVILIGEFYTIHESYPSANINFGLLLVLASTSVIT